MLLIMSGSYVQQELGAEFGSIPPSFLPLANKRLFKHQVSLGHDGHAIYLVLPEDFVFDKHDYEWLLRNKVTMIPVDSNLTLGQAIVTAWNLIGDKDDKGLQLLFGDTLFKKIPAGDDLVAISHSDDNYQWSFFYETELRAVSREDNKNVICGYFSFSKPNFFIRELVTSKFDFTAALKKYHDSYSLASIYVSDWLDFGHINTYYKSKVQYTTQRAFNELCITTKSVIKSSSNESKIEAESKWFETIPGELKIYTPMLLEPFDHIRKSYKLEYLYNTTLNELFVFSRLPNNILTNILISCLDFIDLCKEYHSIDTDKNILQDLFYEKTIERVSKYITDLNIDPNAKWNFNNNISVSINDILYDTNKFIPSELQYKTIMHGDLCFSNIIFNFRTGRIQVFDPRGLNHSGEISIYGDFRYDIAKLSHSILGLYDWIIAGYYIINKKNKTHSIEFKINIDNKLFEIQSTFVSIIKEKYSISEKSLYAMQIHLFLSMLPLHSDDKKGKMHYLLMHLDYMKFLRRLQYDYNSNGGDEFAFFQGWIFQTKIYA
ncbi:capsular biosynthesis protein [Escherichia coli]|uniref:capsular biosynthesis protein n=10 Tax=Escherichia coli TaxID=562 RepID=UPI001E2FE756|nr:capsular biosynthesis protein [Escherichia coli]MCE3761140.1 capsular biosynthesis protein [Escherichia coli]